MEGYQHDNIFIDDEDEIVKQDFPAGRVVLPEFEIYANPTIRIDDVKKRRFSLIDRGRKGV